MTYETLTAKLPYAGARQTKRLVGREKQLSEIEDVILQTRQDKDKKLRVIYLTAGGGMGKTRFLREILSRENNARIPTEGVKKAKALIDLYHTRVHTLSGLSNEIAAVLDFKINVSDTERMEAGGVLFSDKKLKEQAREFIESFNKEFTGSIPALLAIDTIERIRLIDPVQKELGLEDETSTILSWLIDVLPHLKNAVVVLAGRPVQPDETDPLLGELKEKLKEDQFITIDLPGLTKKEAVDYFSAVVEADDDAPDPELEAIGWLARLDEASRQTIFYCLRDDTDYVPPLWLALAIDHLVVAGQPVDEFSLLPDEAEQFTVERREEIRRRLGQELIQAIREGWRSDDGVLTALAWLRKGADAEMIHRVFGYPRDVVEDALIRLKRLSFVKIRTDDDRVRFFLHDEMYDLFETFGIDTRPGPQSEKIFFRLNLFYQGKIKQEQKSLGNSAKLISEESTKSENNSETSDMSPKEIIAKRSAWQDSMVEDLYYKIHWNYKDAIFGEFYEYGEEAFSSKNLNLSMQLWNEVLSFQNELLANNSPDLVHQLRSLAALRWLKQLHVEEKNKEFMEVAIKLLDKNNSIFESGDDLSNSELKVWVGNRYREDGKLKKAFHLLTDAQQTAQQLLESKANPQTTRLKTVLARAYNCLGLYYRTINELEQAAINYRNALPLWRATNVKSAMAATSNNNAYVMGVSGKLSLARRQALDALALRQELWLTADLSFSYNTLAAISIYSGNYIEAEDYALQGHRHALSTDFKFGTGLSELTLAEIYRFQSEDQTLANVKKQEILREKALKYAEGGLKIFSGIGSIEQISRANHILGTIYRELARTSSDPDDRVSNRDQSESYLKKARQQSKNNVVNYIEQSIALGWTYLYSSELKKVERIIDEILKIVKNDSQLSLYVIDDENLIKLYNQYKNKHLKIHIQLLRLYALSGMRWMEIFEPRYTTNQGTTLSDAQQEMSGIEPLRNAANDFMLTLEYSRFLKPSSLEARRAIDNIIESFRSLNVMELKKVFMQIEKSWQELTSQHEAGPTFYPVIWSEIEEYFGPYESIKDINGD